MAWKTLRSGWAKSINCTTGSASPVSSFTSTWALRKSACTASFASNSVRFGCRRSWSRRSSSCRSVSQVLPSTVRLSERTACRKISGRRHSRKLARRLSAGLVGISPCPWSMTVQPSEESWSRNGFSTCRYSDIGLPVQRTLQWAEGFLTLRLLHQGEIVQLPADSRQMLSFRNRNRVPVLITPFDS